MLSFAVTAMASPVAARTASIRNASLARFATGPP
jgi:hypothetical protein